MGFLPDYLVYSPDAFRAGRDGWQEPLEVESGMEAAGTWLAVAPLSAEGASATR